MLVAAQIWEYRGSEGGDIKLDKVLQLGEATSGLGVSGSIGGDANCSLSCAKTRGSLQ